jgi:hypothetical protein
MACGQLSHSDQDSRQSQAYTPELIPPGGRSAVPVVSGQLQLDAGDYDVAHVADVRLPGQLETGLREPIL